MPYTGLTGYGGGASGLPIAGGGPVLEKAGWKGAAHFYNLGNKDVSKGDGGGGVSGHIFYDYGSAGNTIYGNNSNNIPMYSFIGYDSSGWIDYLDATNIWSGNALPTGITHVARIRTTGGGTWGNSSSPRNGFVTRTNDSYSGGEIGKGYDFSGEFTIGWFFWCRDGDDNQGSQGWQTNTWDAAWQGVSDTWNLNGNPAQGTGSYPVIFRPRYTSSDSRSSFDFANSDHSDRLGENNNWNNGNPNWDGLGEMTKEEWIYYRFGRKSDGTVFAQAAEYDGQSAAWSSFTTLTHSLTGTGPNDYNQGQQQSRFMIGGNPKFARGLKGYLANFAYYTSSQYDEAVPTE